MAVVTLTTGVPGSGKTYVRAARYLVDYFLLETEGMYYTNFPLNINEICQEVAKRQKKISFLGKLFFKQHTLKTAEDYSKRIHIIPDSVLLLWRDKKSGPWEYFEGVTLTDAHIAIDEIHNFISSRDQEKEFVKSWDDFLGEVRHRGCTFEGITQDIDQVHDVFKGRASVRLELIPCEDLRDPYFKIVMSDWYNLKAAFLGDFHKTVFEVEKRKNGSKWVTNHTRRFLILPEYFRFYRSYEASLQEKSSGGEGAHVTPKYEYEKRTRLGLLFWFFRKNFFSLFFRVLIIGFIFWLCFGGGLTHIIQEYLLFSGSIASANGINQKPGNKKDETNSKKENKDRDHEADPFQKFYENDLSGFLPAMFLSKEKLVVLRNGTRIYQDYVFTSGTPLEGKKVKFIDFTDRSLLLDSGHLLRMRYIKPTRPKDDKQKKK